MAGTLIVLEGTDGSGKSTQFERLCRLMAAENRDFQRLVFPQYSEPSSALLKMYLQGEFGSHPSDVNAYAASTFYAVDRYASYKKVWGRFYEDGGLVLADRYTTSNAVHQAAKLPEEERDGFFRWLMEFECGKLGLPEPALVLYLDVPTELAVQNLRRREAERHTTGDIHEVDTGYLRTCRETARHAAQVLGWRTVSCTDASGAMRTVDDIGAEIEALVRTVLDR
ncbi:MAG: deoxynucleoside kinase [Oscillospiraceae bacterium]|nr:deoxynucleoside kinase [Oscillospiraceae bacterium]